MKKNNFFVYTFLFALAVALTTAIATHGFTKFGTEALLIPMIVVFAYFGIFFIVAQIVKDNSIVDMGWGLGIVVGSWTTLIVTPDPTLLSFVIAAFITIWGVRLSGRIIKRNFGKPEDFRYAQWRKDWGDKVVIIAFFRVFMLQGILNFIVGSASFTVIRFNEFKLEGLGLVLVIIGLIIALTGLIFEVVGDEQLRRHIKKGNKKLLDTGLWSITRHPNYFGEVSIWIGLYVVGFSLLVTSSIGIVYYLLLVISPLVMSAVLLTISTPLLEKSMASYEGWEDYTKRVPRIFPFGKKLKK